MTIISAFNAVVANIQFIGLLNRLNINWPSEWFAVTNVLDVASLHFENLVFQDTRVSVITQRMMFLFISICVPIAINVLLLILFQPVYIVLWYLTLTTGFVLLVAGLFAEFLPGSLSASGMDPLQFIVVGGALFGAAALSAVAVLLVQYCVRDENATETTTYQNEKRYLIRFHRARSLTHLCVFLISFFVGLVCLHIAVVTAPSGNTSQWLAGALFYIIGFIAFGISGIALIYFLLNLCKLGRRCVVRCIELAKKHLLLLMLTLISFSFIPTISYAVNVYMCHSYTCPVGYVFNPYADRPAASYDTSPARYCDACTFTDSQCGSKVASNHVWCPGMDDNRWWKYPEVTCSDESTVYFYIAAAIVLVNYLFGIPILYYKVITYLTENVVGNARIGPILADETEDEVYTRQLAGITPVAASLYDPYRYSRRYFSLVHLAYRLVITFTLEIAAAYSQAAAALVFAFHGIACAVMVFVRPYISREEQWFATALSVCNMLNGVYAVIVWQVSDVPSYTTYIFVVLNGIIPAIAGIVVVVILRKRRQQLRRHQRKRDMMDAIEAEDRAAEEQKKLLQTTQTISEAAAIVRRRQQEEEEAEEMATKSTEGAAAIGVPSSTGSPTSPNGPATDGVHDSSSSSGSDEDAEQNSPTNPAPVLTPEEKEARKRRLKKIYKIRRKNNDLQTAVYDENSITVMNTAFMFMGVFFVVALGIGFLGLLRSPKQNFLIGGETSLRGSDTMFAGYDTWTNFTQHCCCTKQTTPNPRFTEAERWLCDNGNVLERGRRANNGVDNGLPLRSLCSTTFRTGCSVAVDLTSSNVVVTCSDKASIVPSMLSQTAYDYMW